MFAKLAQDISGIYTYIYISSFSNGLPGVFIFLEKLGERGRGRERERSLCRVSRPRSTGDRSLSIGTKRGHWLGTIVSLLAIKMDRDMVYFPRFFFPGERSDRLSDYFLFERS